MSSVHSSELQLLAGGDLGVEGVGVKVSKILAHTLPDPSGIQQLGSAGSEVSLASLDCSLLDTKPGCGQLFALLQAWLHTDFLGGSD